MEQPEEPPPQQIPGLRSWYQPLLIGLVVLLGYGIEPAQLPLIGEETCRALHGIEMAQTGDWLIATNQAVPILDRPPMQYWMLALVHRWVHVLDPTTLRLFMALVTLATSLMIWWYARRFLTGAGAFVAAVAYPTMGHVLDLGRRAETDGLFTLFMAGSLLVWHYGYSTSWSRLRTWTSAAALASMATLAKGAQGPVTFFGAVYLFLLVRRDWRWLWSWANLAGIALFLGMIAVWQVPFYLEVGWEGTRSTWLDPGVSRLMTSFGRWLSQLLLFPLASLTAMLPWSALLIGLLHRQFWQMQDGLRSLVVFLLLGSVVIFVPVWLVEGGLRRYVMPMYPLLAVLCGAVVQQSVEASSGLNRLRRNAVRVGGILLLVFATVFVLATVAAEITAASLVQRLAQPWPVALGSAACSALAARLMFRRARSELPGDVLVAALAFTVTLSITFTGAGIRVTAYDYADVGPDIVALRNRLSAEGSLVSFEPIHHKFLYFYEETIPALPWPGTAADVPDDVTYFAVSGGRGREIELPFAWEPLAEINMDRKAGDDPVDTVIVGRRKPGR